MANGLLPTERTVRDTMSTQDLNLTEDFPPASAEAWRGLVDKALKGAPFDKKLMTRLYDGITLKPIYTREDWSAENDPSGFPGFAPLARAASVTGSAANPIGTAWDIRQVYSNPDLTAVNAEILADLERGVTSVLLRLDAAGRAGINSDADPELAGIGGLMISTAADLDTALAGVMLDLAPVALDAGAGAPAAAALLTEVWKNRGVTGETARGAFNIDPIGTLAASGALPYALDDALAEMAAIAKDTAASLPNVTAVGVNTSAYYNGGATEVSDLGCAMATGVAYLRAMTAAGMDIDSACKQISFSLPVGTDQFLSIAKLRAARMLWARVCEACGASSAGTAMVLHVDVSDRVISQRDPWVNILRVTVGVFAAGVAQADSVSAPPFDSMLGLPTDFARRIARNTQVVLQEESNLGRVIDPAGGSWFVETLTRQVAEGAWAEFQQIEKWGGIAEALDSGKLQAKIAGEWSERRKAIAKRKDSLTGINEFPNLNEKAVQVKVPDLETLRKGASARLKAAAAAKAATLGSLTKINGSTRVEPLGTHRLAEDWEELRDNSDVCMVMNGARPMVFSANMGRVAQHTARASFARNFFEAGGFDVMGSDGFADADAAAAAFKAVGAKLVVLCGSDDQYGDMAASFATALKAAGASRIYLAGKPADDAKAAFTSAGIEEYIYMGCDALDILRDAQTHLGVSE
jgi:methylmalonyl-CoA mutase